MEGNDADVKEAGEALRGFMTFAGEGTHVASCAAYREKALWACREESDLSRKNSSDDPLILKNISRIYTITYYLGADRKTARRQCNSASDFDRAEFIDFHQKR